jgi:hypothetical protein
MIFAALMEWAKSNPALTLAVIIIITLLSTSGVLYLDNSRLKATTVDLQKANTALRAQISMYVIMVEGAADQIQLAEEQCRRLLQYEENKPKPRPASNGDDDLDDIISRLRGFPAGSSTNAPSKGPSTPIP